MTPRLKQILSIMLRENRELSVQALAEQSGISKRTVQRELESVENCLKDYHIDFRSKTGVGVWLEGPDQEMKRLNLDISQGDSYDVSNREDRRKRLTLEILKEKGLKKLYYYSSQFQVSEATISADLEAINVWLSHYDLFVVRKPGSGIYIKGKEESYRKAIRDFIRENVDTRVLKDFYDDSAEAEYRLKAIGISNIGGLLDDTVIKRVKDCIANMKHERIMNMTENSYTAMIIHITIAINRILQSETIESEGKWQEFDKEDEDYLLAKELVNRLSGEFSVTIPEIEISYIYLHIKGSKHEKIQYGEDCSLKLDNREFKQLLNCMIDAFDKEKAMYLKQDDDFIQGLLVHLQPTIFRILHNMQIHNPVLEDIKENYADIYERCKRVAEVLKGWLKKEVPEEEIGFLTVHFGAALVRLEEKNESIRQVHVGVVCSSGIGISRLMSTKLEKVFKGRIAVTAYGKNEITPYIVSKADFFVSSIPLDITEIPVISVNPLLGENDMEQIRKTLYRYERIPGKSREEDEFTLQLEEINILAAQINAVIKYLEFFKVHNDITFEELLLAIGEKLSPYADRRELIQDDIMKREKIASQIFSEMGFALLHEKTKGVLRPSFTVCMTRDLSPFRDPYFKGITIVLVLLIPDDENSRINREIMGYISGIIIEDCDFLDTIGKGNKEEIRNMLTRHLKQFFYKYLNQGGQ